MPRRVATEDEGGGDDEDWTPDDDEEWVPDEEATAECPRCHEPVFDQAERCPHCGWYISEEDVQPSRRPWWVVLGVVLALVAVYLWVFR
jgi:hypothetical protein